MKKKRQETTSISILKMEFNVLPSDLYANHYSYETRKTSLTDKNFEWSQNKPLKQSRRLNVEKSNYKGKNKCIPHETLSKQK